LDRSATSAGSSLEALLQEASRGNHSAFRALYDAVSPKLFGIVLRITRNRSMAEEVLQETFVKIWQNADRFTPDAGQPMAWLAAIARNRAIDRIRSEKVVPSPASLFENALDSSTRRRGIA